jgi:hypothetical protein
MLMRLLAEVEANVPLIAGDGDRALNASGGRAAD